MLQVKHRSATLHDLTGNVSNYTHVWVADLRVPEVADIPTLIGAIEATLGGEYDREIKWGGSQTFGHTQTNVGWCIDYEAKLSLYVEVERNAEDFNRTDKRIVELSLQTAIDEVNRVMTEAGLQLVKIDDINVGVLPKS